MLFVLFAVFRILKHYFHKHMPENAPKMVRFHQRNWDQAQTTKKHEKCPRGQRVLKVYTIDAKYTLHNLYKMQYSLQMYSIGFLISKTRGPEGPEALTWSPK